MNYSNPVNNARLPKYHEGSGMRSVRDADNNALAWKRQRLIAAQMQVGGQTLTRLQKQVSSFRRRIVGGGTGGIQWAGAGRIYDKSNSYSGNKSVGDLVWVSPTDTVVTTGVTDPDSNLTVKSYPGAYLALQKVTVINTYGTNQYHIPQPNLPVPNNLDDPKNYWLLISPQANCLT